MVIFLLALLVLQPCWGSEETKSETTEVDSDEEFDSEETEDSLDSEDDDDDDSEEDDDDDSEEDEREIEFEMNGLELEIQSRQEVGNVENEIEVEFEIVSSPNLLYFAGLVLHTSSLFGLLRSTPVSIFPLTDGSEGKKKK